MEYKDFTSLEYESTGKEDFYVTLKQRVETYFHNQKVICVTSMTILHNL